MRHSIFLTVAVVLGLGFAAPAHADTLGQSTMFNVSSTYDASGVSRISATLRAVGSMVYVYVDDRYWNSLPSAQRPPYLDRLEQLASDFDGTIRPSSVAFWGTEPTLGLDNDPHVTLLAEKLIPGSGGYFQTVNSYSKKQAPDSNVREMVYLSAESIGSGRASDFTAHEFQHLISFNQRELTSGVSDDVWINELRSEYNITVVGYTVPFNRSALQRRLQSFLQTPNDSLTEWPNTAVDYGTASIFGHYLADRYGGAVLQHTIHSRLRGVRAINEWLAQQSKPERFREVFADWMSAVIVNDQRDSRYGYATTGLNTMRLVPSRQATLGRRERTDWSMRIKDWQAEWIAIDMPTGAPSSPTVTLAVSGHSGADWGGTFVADYSGTIQVVPWRANSGVATIGIPTESDGRSLRKVTFAITQGTDAPVESRMFEARTVTVSATLDPSGIAGIPAQPPSPQASLKDGDLINHNGGGEVYVISGKYRRYLVPGVLELYGFRNRPVIAVSDDVFNSYTSSNYIRVADTEPVYAVWPDGTKHHFNITAAQWDASLRDWGAVFIVNASEGAFYRSGDDITR